MERNLSADWRAHLDARLCSAEDAAAMVQSRDHLWIPAGHASPAFLTALAGRSGELEDVEIRGLAVPVPALFTPEAAVSFHYQDQFGTIFTRPALEARVIDFHPFWLVGGHKALDSGREEAWKLDKVQVTVSEPDENGFVSVGPNVWDSVPAARRAAKVIASVNPVAWPRLR